MLSLDAKGLYCLVGDFYIDPKRAVDHAVITHAHSDHARRGSKKYYCESTGIDLLKTRLGENIDVSAFPYAVPFYLNEVKISFHPAGHILGSAQVRLEWNKQVWVVSGDYKRELDPTCAPFESVPCDVFVTEATFGTPAYTWEKNSDYGKEIFSWWRRNSELGINSVICAYSLGKTQRILAYLNQYSRQTVYCHPAAEKLNACYRKQNVPLIPTENIEEVNLKNLRGELFIVPPSFLKSENAQLLGRGYKSAFASGWMKRPYHRYDKGFLMSDHADWDDLLLSIKTANARQTYVQHRAGVLIKELRNRRINALPEEALAPRNPAQMAFL